MNIRMDYWHGKYNRCAGDGNWGYEGLMLGWDFLVWGDGDNVSGLCQCHETLIRCRFLRIGVFTGKNGCFNGGWIGGRGVCLGLGI